MVWFVDGHWFQKMNKLCKSLLPNETYQILPLIEYIDKTGTNVNQRNKLEPYSFTLGMLNHACLYHSKAWHAWFHT